MKKSIAIIVFSIIFSAGIFAQDSKDELNQLRKEVKLPKAADVFIDKRKDFPTGQTLKIYLSIKHNKKFAKGFSEWIENWNDKNAARYGRLQSVDKISDADVAVAQFSYGIVKYVREDRLSISTGRVSQDPDFVGTGIGNSKIRAERGYDKVVRPLYSYLLVRNNNNSWTVNFSYIDETFDFEKNFPEVRIQRLVENKMKDR